MRKCADFTGKPGGAYALNSTFEEGRDDFSTKKKKKNNSKTTHKHTHTHRRVHKQTHTLTYVCVCV